MSMTDIQIINLGLSKISGSRVRRIDPPQTQLEVFMQGNYAQWKKQELMKRRWVFALVENYQLTQTAVLTDTDRHYKYAMPNDCLRVIRTRKTEWKQVGKFLVSADSNLKIDYIRNAPENDFDPLFNDVLAGKIAWDSAEFVTQSATKKASAKQDYDEAVKIAGQMNAFIIGPEAQDVEDESFSWELGRQGIQ